MYQVRQETLPFLGSSHEFVGAEQGDTNVSVFLFDGKPGSGPGPHRHPYDEIQFIREGRGVWTVNGKTFEGSAGDIFVIKAGEIHSFKALGDSRLVQLDVHLSPRFIQENLPFVGSSHEFVGADQGNTGVSVFLFHGKPGSGPGPHRHPYDEIQFIREGRGVWTVDGKTFEGSAGDIFVIKAGEIHSFKAVGDSPLVQLDVHLSPRFIQENL